MNPQGAIITHSTEKTVLYIAGMAVAYYLAGRLGLLLAIPPGYATPIWPAAGLSLACLLLWGQRLWPGILIGSILVNVYNSFDSSTLISTVHSTSLAFNVGLGSALQALLGAHLIRRTIDIDKGLLQTKPIVLFLLLGGPVSCTVAATWGVTSWWLFDIIQTNQYPFSWMTWWVGDTIGVLLLTPLVFAWFGRPKAIWRQRQVRVAFPLLITLILVALAFLHSNQQERERIESGFNEHAATLANLLDNTLLKNLEVLYSVQNLFQAVDDVSPEQFNIFVRNSLIKHAGLQAISWNPVITHHQRPLFEAMLKTPTGEPAFITDRDVTGQPVIAQPREKYVAIALIEPQKGNETAIGSDIYSNPVRRLALDEAGRSGKLVITKPIKLMQGEGEQIGSLFFLPVYAGSEVPTTEEQRLSLLRGFAMGMFRTSDLLRQAMSGMEKNIPNTLIRLADESADEALLGVYQFDAQGKGYTPNIDIRPPNKQLLSESKRFGFGWRTWNLTVTASPEYMVAHRSWTPWYVLTSGLLFCTSLGAFLLILSGRALLDQRQAQTDWLTGSYNRRFMENTGQKLDNDAVSYAVIMFDLDHFKRINDRWGHQAGDTVLKAVAQWMQEQLPETDYFGRWGGEEFIILTRQTHPDSLQMLAQRWCDGIAALDIDPVDHVTVSLGVACKQLGQTCEQVTRAADEALYQAKHNGRNQVAYAGHPAPPPQVTLPEAMAA